MIVYKGCVNMFYISSLYSWEFWKRNCSEVPLLCAVWADHIAPACGQ